MTISDYQKKVDQWIKTYGIRYFDEKTNMILLMEELGELSRLVARVYGEQSFKKEQLNQDVKSLIADEMSDVLFVLTCLSNQMGIDLSEAIEKNFAKKTDRDHIRHKQNDKLS